MTTSQLRNSIPSEIINHVFNSIYQETVGSKNVINPCMTPLEWQVVRQAMIDAAEACICEILENKK